VQSFSLNTTRLLSCAHIVLPRVRLFVCFISLISFIHQYLFLDEQKIHMFIYRVRITTRAVFITPQKHKSADQICRRQIPATIVRFMVVPLSLAHQLDSVAVEPILCVIKTDQTNTCQAPSRTIRLPWKHEPCVCRRRFARLQELRSRRTKSIAFQLVPN